MSKGAQTAAPGTVRKVLSYLRRYWPLLVLSLLFGAASVAMTLAVPILIGQAIDAMIGAGQVLFDRIAVLLVEIAVLVALTACFNWLMATVNNRISFRVVRDLRNAAFEKIGTLPL